MKKGRFLWSAHRITEKQKVRKARNIKEKQLKNSRSTVSRQLVALRSSANDNFIIKRVYKREDNKPRKTLIFRGFSLHYSIERNSVNLYKILCIANKQETRNQQFRLNKETVFCKCSVTHKKKVIIDLPSYFSTYILIH